MQRTRHNLKCDRLRMSRNCRFSHKLLVELGRSHSRYSRDQLHEHQIHQWPDKNQLRFVVHARIRANLQRNSRLIARHIRFTLGKDRSTESLKTVLILRGVRRLAAIGHLDIIHDIGNDRGNSALVIKIRHVLLLQLITKKIVGVVS